LDTIVILLLCLIVLLQLGNAEATMKVANMFGRGRRKIILDSCALIDGRIVDLVRTGFVSDELVIPKFILRELQLLADGKDPHKRERARFGLEIAAELQEYSWANVSIDESNVPGATDDKLVRLAKKRGAVLCTTDYNLNKVATVESVRTLNVNELAQSLRPVTLPGETIEVKILQKGSNGDQGVGYLEDGTMIVVDGAAKSVGASVQVVVDRMHQTVAGKMVFAHKAAKAQTASAKPAAPARRSTSNSLTPQTKRSRLISLSPKGALARSRKTLSPRRKTIQ